MPEVTAKLEAEMAKSKASQNAGAYWLSLLSLCSLIVLSIVYLLKPDVAMVLIYLPCLMACTAIHVMFLLIQLGWRGEN